jgi:Ca2+-dependent lipid-binding protein
MQRELTKTRLFKEAETADWMNNFLSRFWRIYEPVLSTTIMNSVAQILSTSTPAFLDSIALTTFSLGNKAPHIDHVKTDPSTDEETVEMQWAVSFTPNDVTDMTYRQAARKENPKIILEIRIGKGVTAKMPILLEDITFKGVMNIRLKLINAFPHVQIVDISFEEPPWIDYVLKPIGGETFGFDIASIPGLSPFIRDTVHSILGPVMYKPAVFTLNLEQLMSGVPLDTAIGVLQITIVSASGIKTTRLGGGNPDPYASVSINNTMSLERTRPKTGTSMPVWNETKFVLVSALTGILSLTIWDYNEHRRDTNLGVANWELKNLAHDSSIEGIVEKVFAEEKERGEIKFDISFFPVIKPAFVDGKPEPLPETTVGIVRLVVHQAKELDPSKNTVSKDLNPYVKVYTGDSGDDFIHSTPVVKHQLNPIWESAKEFLCSDRDKCDIRLEVIDDRDFLSDPMIGLMKIRLNDLLEAKKQGKDWFPLAECKTGRVRITAEWKPLDMAGSLHGAAKYVPPIGVVRVLMKKAADVKNVEAALGGKSDPYVRVMINNTIMARTEVVNNNLNPAWDQFMYIPVHSLKESLYFECMDYQHLTRDRPLGHAELTVSSLAIPGASAAADTEYLYDSLGLKEFTERLKIDNVFKGELHFTAEFLPALHLANVSFEGQKNPIEKSLENEEGFTYEAVPATPAENALAPANGEQNGTAAEKQPNGNGAAHHEDGVTMSKEQLLATRMCSFFVLEAFLMT